MRLILKCSFSTESFSAESFSTDTRHSDNSTPKTAHTVESGFEPGFTQETSEHPQEEKSHPGQTDAFIPLINKERLNY